MKPQLTPTTPAYASSQTINIRQNAILSDNQLCSKRHQEPNMEKHERPTRITERDEAKRDGISPHRTYNSFRNWGFADAIWASLTDGLSKCWGQ